jgi:hypothetical protein
MGQENSTGEARYVRDFRRAAFGSEGSSGEIVNTETGACRIQSNHQRPSTAQRTGGVTLAC